MAADALASCITRTSATVILTLQDEPVLNFHEVEFQPTLPIVYWEMIENVNEFVRYRT